MTLVALFLVPALGALLCYLMRDRTAPLLAGVVALCNLLQGIQVFVQHSPGLKNYPWIPSLGINMELALHPGGVGMLVLTPLLTLGAVCVLRPQLERAAEFCGHLLLLLAALQGLFVAENLALFYIFFELMLLPTLFLVARWGGENGRSAALKFFLYTLLGSLPMLLGVLTVSLMSSGGTGSLAFANLKELPEQTQQGVFWLFAIAFLVKLPVFPLHGWQVDLYRSAPAPVTAVVAGAMSKAGVYGLLLLWILFPVAAAQFAPMIAGLALVSLLYGGMCALGASDLRRILAYSSLSHLGLVTLAVFAGGDAGREGAILQMFSHGIATGGLFLWVATLENRGFTSELSQLGGLAATLPRLAALGLVLAMASLGCPGLCSFPAELAMLIGVWQTSPALAGLASLSVILAAWYGLRFYQGVMNGPALAAPEHDDVQPAEWLALLGPVVLCFAVGLFPYLTFLQWTRF